ncbi:MAG: hypothetical protein GWP18_04340 [Proteobacteria bacterium]|nr:hypothetical protein [Pseudomonadota bacterium]
MARRRFLSLLAGAAGALGGLAVGAVIAVNIVIFSGIEPGYEATIPEVFSQNVAVGIVTVAVLAAGPIVGVAVALRLRGR